MSAGETIPDNVRSAPVETAAKGQVTARWEILLPNGTLRPVGVAEEVFPAILSGEILGNFPCRAVLPSTKDGKVRAVKWGLVENTLGASGFAARVLFRPIWAHALRGLEIGAALGFVIWLSLNVWNSLSAAFELIGPQYNGFGRHAAVKFAAYGIVNIFWLWQYGASFAKVSSLSWLNSLITSIATVVSPIASRLIIPLILLVIIDPSAFFNGLSLGLGSAFGSFVVGSLALGPPGMIVGAITGLIRTHGRPSAFGWPREALFPVLMWSLFLPFTISAVAITLYMRYADEIVEFISNSITESFLR